MNEQFYYPCSVFRPGNEDKGSIEICSYLPTTFDEKEGAEQFNEKVLEISSIIFRKNAKKPKTTPPLPAPQLLPKFKPYFQEVLK